jgi:hypothetical protein
MVTRHTHWSVHVFGAVLSEQRGLRLSSVLWIRFKIVTNVCSSRDSTVCIAAGYGLDGRGVGV